MPRAKWLGIRVFTLLMLFAGFSLASVMAAKTSAGTTITNQAEITWYDTETGVVNRAYSNISTVVVAQQFSLFLESDNTRHTQPSRTVYLSHRLVNTGNVASAYEVRVRQENSDSADLSDLELISDVNGNGIADAGEPVLMPMTCNPSEANVSCYEIDTLDPAEVFEFVVSGLTPANGVPEDEYKLNVRAFPVHYDQIVNGITPVNPSVPREVDLAFSSAITDSQLPDNWVNNDVVDIIEGAVLSLTKMATPSCGVPIKAGQLVSYSIGFTNVGDAAPEPRDITLDGEQVSGVILEDTLPPNVTFDKTSLPIAAPYQSIVMVQLGGDEDSSRWLSFTNWNGTDVISKVGQLVPADQMQPNQSGKLEFDVTVNQNVTATTVYNQVNIDLIKGGLVEFESNTVCTNIEPGNTRSNESEQPDVVYDATISFLTPVVDIKRDITQNNTTPDFYSDDDFEAASIYKLDNGLGSYDIVRDGVYVQLVSSAVNKEEDTQDTIVVTVTSGTGDTLQLTLLETGPNTGIFRSIHPIRMSDTDTGQGRPCPAAATSPSYSTSEPSCVLNGDPDGNLSVAATVTFDNGQSAQVLEDAALIDPLGIVFDSAYNTPVEGATVWIRNADGSVALDPLTDQPYEPQVTGSDGRYQFPFLYPNQSYYLDVDPPSQYSFPSIVETEPLSNLGRVVNEYSYGKDGYKQEVVGSGIFTLTSLLIVDIPLDPELNTDLTVQKSASVSEVNIGSFVNYSVRIKNHTNRTLYAVQMKDSLPRGFKYVEGTAKLNGVKIDDPAGSPRPNLVFTNLPFVDGAADGVLDNVEHVLTYRVRVTSGAVDSDGVNSVIADGRTETSYPINSNESRVKVKIERAGILDDRGILFGKVFVDADCNNIQSGGEWPIAGVKLYMEDGTWVITDANGQYSLYGIEPGNHVIKVDPITVPKGIEFKPTDNRQMADPDSRLIDMNPGEFHRADFAAICPKVNREEIHAEIVARNTGQTDWMLSNAQKYDPDKTLNDDDLRKESSSNGDISHGVIDENQLTKQSSEGRNSSQHSLTTGYSVQVGQYKTQKAADDALLKLSKNEKPKAFVYPVGDFYTLRQGFDLDKKAMQLYLKSINAAKQAQIVMTVYERLNDETADRLETPRSIEAMPSTKDVVKTVTKRQAKVGEWLWPRNNISIDGRFMVVVRKGLTPTLFVNGKSVEKSQLGEQIENRRESAQVLAWYGVQLKPGKNKLKVTAKDMFGNLRILAEGEFTRPTSAKVIKIESKKKKMVADGGRSYLPMTIKLLDSNGNLARGVNFVTLEASKGRWVERDVQDRVQGRQIRVVNGLRKVHLRSSEYSGKTQIKVSNGTMHAEMQITQVEPLRPLIAAGLVDVGGQLFKRGNNSPDLMNEDEFNAHAAAFLKGDIGNGMHLTMSVDTDKDPDASLFRDINPNKSYPIHGDSSQRGYEAQSRSKVYAKLEKDDDSVMWGDFVTDGSTFNEDVTRVQRSLTGANVVAKKGATDVQLFVSELDETNVVERIRGRGVALNYKLQNFPIVVNSETIEIITVSRDNPGVVLSTTTLSRFGDYQLDEVTGELSFSDVVAIVDEALNPVYIQASYDVEGAADKYTVAGARVTHKIKPGFKVGLSYTVDQNDLSGFEIYGGTLQFKDDDGLDVKGSIARLIPRDISEEAGIGGRLYISKAWDKSSSSSISLGRASSGFDHSSAGISAGREELRIKHEKQITEDLSLQIEAIHSKNLETGDKEQSLGITSDVKVKDWTVKGGVRHVQQETGTTDDSFQTFIVGAKRSLDIAGRKGSVEAEYEQAFGGSDRQRIALVADAQIHDKVKAYARAERINSLSGVSGLSSSTGSQDTIAVGIKSNFLPSTEVFSEYRVRGATDGRDMETASGVRGTYELSKGLSISPHFEIVNNIEGSGSDSIAASLALKDTRSVNQKSSMRLETRHDEGRDYYGLQTDFVKRLDQDWSLLFKDTLRYESPDDSGDSLSNTLTLGMAYRPRRDNQYHSLFFYQNKETRNGEDEDCSTHVLSTHQNYEINEDVLISGRAGAKHEDCEGYQSDAVLLDGRITWDINRRLDLDIHAGILGTDGVSEKNYSVGAGVNYLLKENLRLGAGYNVKGFDDDDLDPENFNDQGFYMGLQYKFDEKSLNWLTGE